MRWRLLLAAAVATVLGLLAWALASGFARRFVLAAQVLDELRRPGPSSWLRRATREPIVSATTLEYGGFRFAADLYRPAAGTPAAPLLFVPGLVEEGKDEARVAPFASLLARAGFVVVTPDLPSFRSLRIHPDNERELAAALDAVLARPDLAPHGRCGVFAVSYAGGIAVLAALEGGRSRRVPVVAAVGAFADLERSLEFLATGRTTFRGRSHLVRPDLYGRFVFLRTFEEFLRDPGDRDVLEQMAARRFADPSAPLADLAPRLGPEGRLLYDLFERADPGEVPALVARLPEGLRGRMRDLSPVHRDLSTLRSSLYLVHARDDGTFPVDDVFRFAELARAHTRVRLLVMASLVHVDPAPWRSDLPGFLTRDLPEAARLHGWWRDLIGECERYARP